MFEAKVSKTEKIRRQGQGPTLRGHNFFNYGRQFFLIMVGKFFSAKVFAIIAQVFYDNSKIVVSKFEVNALAAMLIMFCRGIVAMEQLRP